MYIVIHLGNKKYLILNTQYSNLYLAILVSARMLLFCFFPWLYILNVGAFSTVLLIFSVLPSTYSVIYSGKYALYLVKF